MRKVNFISIVVCLLSIVFLANTAYSVQYEIIDLGTFGGSNSSAMAINNSGQIVGNANYVVGTGSLASEYHSAFLYESGGMINLGTYEVKILDDGWTVITADKKPSAHFEHTIAVTKNGPRILTLDP